MLRQICQRCLCYQNVQLPTVRTVISYNVHNRATDVITDQHWLERLLPKWRSKEDLHNLLLDNVLYEDDHIIAFNKPAKLAMYSLKFEVKNEARNSTSLISIEAVLPLLKRSKDLKMMKEVFSLNRLYSGVTVFAKTQRAMDILSKYFMHTTTNKIHYQRYRALTLGIPDSQCTIEKFLLKRKQLSESVVCFKSEKSSIPRRKPGQVRDVISSELDVNTIRTSELSKSCGVAIVDISPTKCKWDLLQVFLLHKLAPALGDHHYSQRLRHILGKPIIMDFKDCNDQTSIQTLPPEVSSRLQLNGLSDVEKLPLHIHCQELSLPIIHQVKGHLASEKMLIKAPLPSYFEESQSLLGLTTDSSHC